MLMLKLILSTFYIRLLERPWNKVISQVMVYRLCFRRDTIPGGGGGGNGLFMTKLLNIRYVA